MKINLLRFLDLLRGFRSDFPIGLLRIVDDIIKLILADMRIVEWGIQPIQLGLGLIGRHVSSIFLFSC